MKLTISKTLSKLPVIDYRSLTDLQGNLKELHQKEFDKLKKSLFGTDKKPKQFDFPLYVCQIEGTNYIFDGHQRLRVLKTLNAEPFELPCVFVEAKSLKEAKEKLLTLNSNYGKVTKEGFDEFVATDFDIDFVTDFTTFEGFMDFEDVTQETEGEDEVPAEPKNIFVVRGDIFEIKANGVKIRVGCLDSTNSDDIEKLMAGQKAQIGFTSPPYNLGNKKGITNSPFLRDTGNAYDNYNDDKTDIDYFQFLKDITKNTLLNCEYSLINIQSLAGNKRALIEYQYEFKDYFADVALWVKTNPPPAMAKNVMNSAFEYIFIFSSEKEPSRAIKTGTFHGTFSNIYTSSVNSENIAPTEHSATFSVSFAEHFITNFCEKSVLDLFCGTGTTAVACLKNKRNCFTNDISENYVQISVKRLIDFCQTNNFAFDITLNGKPFDTELLN